MTGAVVFMRKILKIALILLAVCAFVASAIIAGVNDRIEPAEFSVEHYKVKSGDSLWSIAYTFCPEGYSIRDWIDDTMSLNQLTDATIYPGQTLRVYTTAE